MIINPQIFNFLKSFQNPQQAVMQMLEKKANGNPLFANLLSLAQQNDSAGIEEIARNMMKEKGLDFDNEFNTFKQNMGLK